VFALALGCALGALLRRIPWAVVATVVVYGLVLFAMVTTVRPVLAPQTFVPFAQSGYSSGYSSGFEGLVQLGPAPWDLGSVVRFVPGYVPPAGSPSAATFFTRCGSSVDFVGCTAVHHVQFGEAFQLSSNYWALQWREVAVYLIAALLLLVVSWWGVRRWRA
jgi:hypothetical protein